MLQTFSQLARNVKIKAKLVAVDNFVFQLHYRYTFWLLLVCTVLVSSRQYIGEHIRCITDTIQSNVINTYCFFTTTFTVVKHLNSTQVAHPGVGPLASNPSPWEEPVIHHAYYQWVPFVLFGQAIIFHLPHLIWRAVESNTVRSLVGGLEHAYLSVHEEMDFKSTYGVIPSRQTARKQVKRIRTAFLTRLHVNRWWGYQLMCCELMNLINIFMQILITDAFLGGWFLNLGPFVNSPPDGVDALDVVFPKVTKCTFQKYGPSGTIQQHDALCVMALNIINEKIYLFLWYWFILLATVTSLGFVWRIATMLLHNRSVPFSRWVFRWAGVTNIDHNSFRTVMENCLFSDWLFLYYLTKNLHGYATAELFNDLAVEMQEMRKSGSRRWTPNGRIGMGQEDAAIPLNRAAESSPERTPEPPNEPEPPALAPPADRPHTE